MTFSELWNPVKTRRLGLGAAYRESPKRRGFFDEPSNVNKTSGNIQVSWGKMV